MPQDDDAPAPRVTLMTEKQAALASILASGETPSFAAAARAAGYASVGAARKVAAGKGFLESARKRSGEVLAARLPALMSRALNLAFSDAVPPAVALKACLELLRLGGVTTASAAADMADTDTLERMSREEALRVADELRARIEAARDTIEG